MQYFKNILKYRLTNQFYIRSDNGGKPPGDGTLCPAGSAFEAIKFIAVIFPVSFDDIRLPGLKIPECPGKIFTAFRNLRSMKKLHIAGC